MRVLRGNAALIATDRATGQEYVFRLPAPMRLGAPRRVQARFVEESLDRSVVNVVTVGNPVYEVTGRFRFVDRPQEWLDLISMAADQRYSLTYVRDLSRPGDEWQVVVIHPDDAVAVEPDPDRFAFAEYEATVVMRSSQPWGLLLGASDVLFRYHAGAPGLTTTRQSPATSRDRTGVIRTAAPGVLRLDWRDGRPYALVEPSGENLIPLNRRKFEGWTAYQGAVVTITQGQTIPGYSPPGAATRIQTTGGTHVRKYWLPLGQRGGEPETQSVVVQNIGEHAVEVFSTTGGPAPVVVQPGETMHVVTSATETTPNSDRNLQFRALDPAHDLDFIAYAPQVELSPIATSYIPEATRDRDLVSTDYTHPPGSCAVYMAGISAGGDQGMIGTAGARLLQIGSGTSVAARSLILRTWPPNNEVLLTLGNGSASVDSSAPAIPVGAEYQRLVLLDVDEVTAQARVRLLQRHRESGGAWVDADGGWSAWLDVSELLALGWQSPHLTIGNVREGTRAGRLVLSDMVVVRGAGHDIDSLIRRFIGRP